MAWQHPLAWDKARWLAWAVNRQVEEGELDGHDIEALFDAGFAHGRAAAELEHLARGVPPHDHPHDGEQEPDKSP